MRLFTRIVELGSFTRAAEQLGLPRASATQIIKQLESHLGVRQQGRLEQVTCASAGYLATHPAPTRLDALDEHWMVDYLSASTGKSLPLEFEVDGRLERRSLRSRLSVNSGDA
ncbi:LysR family transcriptional regulator [Thiohalocapsa marina]|uniref:LysR family transcriptional regulator n=1 Tax=Thiohalocapsa marina TaxID=424902 RepID=UPI001B87878B|nr:LysR family transcriptional regulator [Thiohalocapsa marina]